MMQTAAGSRATVACAHCGRLNRVDLARAGDGPKCGSCGKPIVLDRPMRLTDAEFDRVVADSSVPVLVDFYADWCGPCKMMAPVLDQAAREHSGRVLVAKVDTDANPMLARKFRIASIPTLVAFKGGAEVARELGALPRTRLNALIERALA
jgi:thioredoxin 2